MGWSQHHTAEAATADVDGQNWTEKLNLSESDLTDSTFREILEKFPKLTTINISGTAVTDAGLSHLRGFPGIHTVYWHNCDESTREFRRKLATELELDVIDQYGDSSFDTEGFENW
jgi:hypothetical protein